MGRVSRELTKKPGKRLVDGYRAKMCVHFGRKMLELRQRDGVFFKDLAAATGYSQPYLCNIENGQSIPGIDLIYKLSKHFKVSMDSWLEGFEPLAI